MTEERIRKIVREEIRKYHEMRLAVAMEEARKTVPKSRVRAKAPRLRIVEKEQT